MEEKENGREGEGKEEGGEGKGEGEGKRGDEKRGLDVLKALYKRGNYFFSDHVKNLVKAQLESLELQNIVK
jgi:hypothetical protein